MFDLNEFLGITENEKPKVNQSANYISFKNPGIYVIRILEKFTPINVHYLQSQKVSVLCIGKDCPICARNSMLFQQFDKEATHQKEFTPRQTRYVSNVLDRTPSVFCSSCGEQVYNFMYKDNMACPACGSVIPKQPFSVVDTVKLVSLSKTFIEQLKVIAASILDDNGDVVPLTHYDIKVISAIVSDRTQLSPSPSDKISPPPEVPKESLYPPEKIAIAFSKDELVAILGGVNYRDILKARNSENTTDIVGSLPVEMGDKVAEEAKNVVDAIKDLFGED